MKLFHVRRKSQLKVIVSGKYGEMDGMVKKGSHAVLPFKQGRNVEKLCTVQFQGD
jgi:hypothetical protein